MVANGFNIKCRSDGTSESHYVLISDAPTTNVFVAWKTRVGCMKTNRIHESAVMKIMLLSFQYNKTV